jgi:hypothetical protein
VTPKPSRAATWLGSAALVVLAARALAYALSPSPLARELEGQAAGPAFPIVAVVSLALAVALSAGFVWLAAFGVAERLLLETRPVLFEPQLHLRRLVLRACALWLVTMAAFALLESYLHWRQGLGWHGLHCLTGPVHRNAIPILGALSLLAAALRGALEHVLAWMRRTLAELAPRPRLALVRAPHVAALCEVALACFPAVPAARGPPRCS